MHSNLLVILILLSCSVLTVLLARRFRLPSLLAYLVIGIVLGPHGLQLLAENHEVDMLAELGIAFLMFSIGLEFSLPRLKAMHGLVFGFGGAQVVLTATATILATWFGYGQRWETGIAVGLAVAMSSTAIVARMLSERFELHSRSGRQTMGVLLFQDLAVVPCLILLPALARPQEQLAESMLVAVFQTFLVLLILIGLGRRPVKAIFDAVARRRSEELFILTTLWIVLALGFATHSAGLSLALGAFIGGMLISETIYRHQVEADIRPFRDILLGLFFISVGMMLNVAYVFANWPLLLLATALLIGGKGLVVMLVARLARSTLDVCLRTSAQLAQAGEFGLVLIDLAHEQKLVSGDVFQVTLSAMLISMFAAPFLIERAARFSGELARGDWAHKAKQVHDIAVGAFGLDQHVILCGYGRTGQHIGKFLAEAGIAFVALDLDLTQVKHKSIMNGRVAFGNADRPEVLKAAGISRAAAIVIAYPDTHSAERVIRQVRHVRPDIPIVVRVPDETHVAKLKAAGATEVIPEVVEGGLMIAAETLIQLGIPVEQAMTRVRAVRAERYASLRAFYQGSMASPGSSKDGSAPPGR